MYCSNYRFEAYLFSDAKLGKYPPKKVVRRNGSGDLSEGLLREAQLFGEQLSGPRVI